MSDFTQNTSNSKPTISSWLGNWAVPLVLALVGGVSFYYSSINEMQKSLYEIRTSIAEMRIKDDNVVQRVAFIELWKDQVQNTRFTSQEGAVLRQEIQSMRSEAATTNAIQDDRITKLAEGFSSRISAITDRVMSLEMGRTKKTETPAWPAPRSAARAGNETDAGLR